MASSPGLRLVWMTVMMIIISPSFGQESGFVFNGFSQTEDGISVDGSAAVLPNGLLQLTPASEHQMGHAFFKTPLDLISDSNFSFFTHFVCALVPKPGVLGGHGITFVLSASSDLTHAESTRYLGILNASTFGHDSAQIFAIELDTVFSGEFNDIDGNHVGIDVNSLISVESASAAYFSDSKGKNESLNLLSLNPIHVWVDYEARVLNVSLAPLDSDKPSRPLISRSIDVSEIFPSRKVFLGFSGSTGTLVSYQYLLGWSFSSNKDSLQSLDISKLPRVPRPKPQHKPPPLILIVLFTLLAILVLALLVGAYLYRRKKYAEISETWEKEFGAHRFSYKSLYKATKGFHRDGFLGKGGFGEVYKGNLPPGTEIAVKRMTHDGEQGMKQFVAEVVSMKNLKHRNLVPLLGYCRRKGEFFLVSEFMPNGSLDECLFDDDQKPVISWSRRHEILKGIALALNYLHTEADQVVLHRDIKASNVMLDAEFNGRLGDFGMARFHDHGGNPATTAAVGTVGYMAPELIMVGASTKTDVYAFGVFMLEVTCGRRPVVPDMQPEKRQLVKWACECWRNGLLLDCRDPRLDLGEEIDLGEIEVVLKLGLLCSNILPELRPTMEQVVQYLHGNLPLPEFTADTPGIGAFAPIVVDSASLLASSTMWSLSTLSVSTSSVQNSSSRVLHLRQKSESEKCQIPSPGDADLESGRSPTTTNDPSSSSNQVSFSHG